ncbi:MAG: glycosyltransferase family 2 protein [Candidatus Kariarchaeaceae archaeon]|jgi:glycosyltransferase involved in cell wall biosynthesis
MTQEQIFILIPALNEEKAIALVLNEIPKINAEVVVIDNGSNDNTADIAIERGATVILGFLDADFSDYPEDLIKLITAIRFTGSDLVLGKRLDKLQAGAMSPHAIIANKVFTALIRMLYGIRLNDMGPMRVIRYQTLLDLDMQDTGYGWAAEMIVKAIKLGCSIQEVRVRYRPRIGHSKISGSFFTSLKAAIWLSFYILRYGLKSRSN